MVDRSLGSLAKMSESSFLGKWTPTIFKVFSHGWILNSDENYYETKCFKMLTQDPWDNTVDQFCALNAQVAKVAAFSKGKEPVIFNELIEKTYKAMRTLIFVENKLCLSLRQNI